MMETTTTRSAYLSIAFGVLMLGTGPIFVKAIHANGFLVAFWRMAFAAFLLSAIILVRGKGRFDWSRLMEWKRGVWGGLAFTINITLFCTALLYLPVANLTLLDNTAPIWVGLLSWFFLRQRPARAFWLGLGLSLIGAAILIGLGSEQVNSYDPSLNLLGVFAGISYGAFVFITARVRERMESLYYTWLMAVVGVALLLPVTFFTGQFKVVLPLQTYGLIFLMALSSQVIGWVLINRALGILPTGAAAVTLIGQPLVAITLGALLIGEVPTPLKIVGGILCLAGIVVVHRYTPPVSEKPVVQP
jgi:drug/metabolite transporter (DMT)-like permease